MPFEPSWARDSSSGGGTLQPEERPGAPQTCPSASPGLVQMGAAVPTAGHGARCCARQAQQDPGRLTGRGGLDCPEGRWGLGCQEICPACEHDGACEPETGACRCHPGYTGSRCQDGECCAARPPPLPVVPGPTAHPPSSAVCPAGWFGLGCHMRCSCANDGLCHPVTGRCTCAPGWTGRSCQRGRWPLSSIHPPGEAATRDLGGWQEAPTPGLAMLPVSSARPAQDDRAVLQPVTAGTGDLTAATPATAAQAMGAVMLAAACACARLATWAPGASSVSPDPAHSRAPCVCHRGTHAHVHTSARGSSPAPVPRQGSGLLT